jgi:hypothetical protein
VTRDESGFDPLTTTTAAVAPATTGLPGTADSTTAPPAGSAASLVDLLVVAPQSSPTPYRRDLFEHWIDADRDGCNTRCEVLEAERRTDLPGLESGWYSIYDGYSTDDPSELEVDHVVALAEAWRSGAHAWDSARRQAFANDLDEPGALIAVTSATNQAKSDKDPYAWQPSNRAAWCEWGLGWVRTKVKWALTADSAEVAALHNVLRGC